MKSKLFNLIAVTALLFTFGCGGGDGGSTSGSGGSAQSMVADDIDPMENRGVGPITEDIVLAPNVDEALAKKGKEVYDKMCTACHKPTQKFIGPAPQGIFERRRPEWVMNMILDPERMVKEDPIAKALLKEYNGSPMANQHLTEDEARAVLEYFRTL